MNGRQTSVAVLALLGIIALLSVSRLSTPGTHDELLQRWPEPARKLDQDGPRHAFKPILAHAAHPRTRKILLHDRPTTHLPFFDASATDLDESTSLLMSTSPQPLSLLSTTQTLLRPKHKITSLNHTRAQRMAFNEAIEWEDVEVEVPDVTDRETLRTLAKMASNAYITPESSEWWGLDEWNSVSL